MLYGLQTFGNGTLAELKRCTIGMQAAAAGLPPAAAGVSGKRSGSGQEGCAWSGRKKQRTADTPDVANVALSNGCEQPAAILGMVPCPPEASLLPLVRSKVGCYGSVPPSAGWRSPRSHWLVVLIAFNMTDPVWYAGTRSCPGIPQGYRMGNRGGAAGHSH